MKRLSVGLFVVLAAVGVLAQGPLTNFMNLSGVTDANGNLLLTNNAASGAVGPLTSMANLSARTDASGYLMVALGSAATNLLFSPDNTYSIGANGATRPSNVWAAAQVSGSTLTILSGNAAKFAWSSGNAWASGATPTISSGFGTAPAITGSASVFRVTLGNPVAQAGIVLFNASPAFGSAPFVSCRDETTQTANPPTYTVTTTQVTITFTTAVAGDTVVCSVQGLP